MTQETRNYHINEFAVDSEIDLDCDAACRSQRVIPSTDTLLIRRASLKNIPSLLRKIRRQIIYDVGDGFLLEPKEGVALHIDIKAKILTIDSNDEDLPIACAWAKHAGFGAATIARGGLPLHAAGLVMDGKFFGLIARSGTGKSTMTWFLLQRGAIFANDDLIPVRIDGADAIAFPSVSLYPKLLREACDRYHLDIPSLIRAHYGTKEEEYYVPLLPTQRAYEPQSLSALFILNPQTVVNKEELGSVVQSRRLSVNEAATTLKYNLHTTWLINKWMNQSRIQFLCRSVAERVPVYTLYYTRSFEVLPALHEVITSSFALSSR